MRKVAIIGAGAAGMTAAITAASNGAEVVVLEHMDRVGKKILSTGNGRCNFTNTYQDRSCYHSDNESFPWKIIEKFNAEQIINCSKNSAFMRKTEMDTCIPIRIRHRL